MPASCAVWRRPLRWLLLLLLVVAGLLLLTELAM
jgi:hypothetical protein